MTRYIFLFKSLFRYHLLRVLEFRSELIGWALISLMWPILTLSAVGLIFGQVDSIAGWEKNEVLLVACLFEIFVGLIWLVAIPSILNFTKAIRKGDFDFYLTKPINPRFLASFNQYEFDQYPRLIMLTVVLVIILQRISAINFLDLIGGIILLFLGVFIFYNLFFFVATSVFWFINLVNLENLFESIIDTGRFPVYVFQKALFLVFVYIIPGAFIATFPAQTLLGRGSITIFITAFVLATVSFLISQWFWNFAIKRYSSASS